MIVPKYCVLIHTNTVWDGCWGCVGVCEETVYDTILRKLVWVFKGVL